MKTYSEVYEKIGDLYRQILVHKETIQQIESEISELNKLRYQLAQSEDGNLTKVTICRRFGIYGVTNRSDGVIVKRTSATVSVRPFGLPKVKPTTYRMRNGQWRESPRPRDSRRIMWLEGV